MTIKIFSFIFLFISLVYAQSIGPVVSVPKIDYDFSHAPIGTSVEHSFVIYNGGGSLLKLGNLKTNCKCISANLDKNELAPGDSAHVDVTYVSKGNGNPQDNYITIKTNDPNNPDLKLFITRAYPNNRPTLSGMPVDSSFHPTVSFQEISHDFGTIKQGKVVDYIFKFSNTGNTALIIKDITTSCGCTAAVAKSKEILPGDTGELRVQFDSAGKIGNVTRMISVVTNDPKSPRKILTINAEITK